MNWFKKILPSRIKTNGNDRRTVPEGVWTKCNDCGAVLYREELDKNLEVCPKCNHHMKISARTRLEYFLDEEYKKTISKQVVENKISMHEITGLIKNYLRTMEEPLLLFKFYNDFCYNIFFFP